MNRTLKQFVYGFLYIVFWFAIIYGGYSLITQAPPTCTDGILNRDEAEVDCGGRYCQDCAIKSLVPIQIARSTLVPGATSGRSNLLLEIRNPNQGYGVERYQYRVEFVGADGTAVLAPEIGEVVLYPAEVKYRAFVNLPLSFDAGLRVQATGTILTAWRSIDELSKPKLPVRSIEMAYEDGTGRGMLKGIVTNDNPFAISRATVTVIISDKTGSLVAVSKTFVRDLTPSEERSFEVVVILPEGVSSADVAEPVVIVDGER